MICPYTMVVGFLMHLGFEKICPSRESIKYAQAKGVLAGDLE
jgi:hypothetical protein